MKSILIIVIWVVYTKECFASDCETFMSKTAASSFLSNGKRSTPTKCCAEEGCEEYARKGLTNCHTEQYREYIVTFTSAEYECSANSVMVTSWCPDHYGLKCGVDICDAIGTPRCENGGTCISSGSSWQCVCVPGYTGVICAIDIDECASSPCQNGKCTDRVNMFKCDCVKGFYGTLCDTGVCRPLPADVVFVLDSSVSMTESQFNKQLEFVSNFTDEVKLGHRDFQISVITYSFDAHIEFHLDQYRDNVTLKEAIANIKYKPGITNTHLGLEMVKMVFGPNRGGDIPRYNNTQADRFVYLLTDGLSNKRRQTVQFANQLKHDLSITISAIGIGREVSHKELYDIATKTTDSGNTVASVYSVDNFSSLYAVLKELVQVTCEECSRSKKSDVTLLLDISYSMTREHLALAQNALNYVVGRAELGESETKFSLTTFGASINIAFNSSDQKNDVLAELNKVLQSTDDFKVDMADVLNFTRMNVLTNGRSDARNFIIFVGNGNFTVADENKFEEAKAALKTFGVDIIVIGTGSGVSIGHIESLTWDPFNVYFTPDDMNCDDGSCDNLAVIQSYFTYSDCDLE